EGGWNTGFTQRNAAIFLTTVIPLTTSNTSVVSVSGVPAVLDGILVTGGRADLGDTEGGGLRIVNSGAVVTNCRIAGNRSVRAGGGIWVNGGSPYFQDSTIEDNFVSATGSGAGAGVMVEDGSGTFVRVSISDNRIETFGGAGGGIAIENFN